MLPLLKSLEMGRRNMLGKGVGLGTGERKRESNRDSSHAHWAAAGSWGKTVPAQPNLPSPFCVIPWVRDAEERSCLLLWILWNKSLPFSNTYTWWCARRMTILLTVIFAKIYEDRVDSIPSLPISLAQDKPLITPNRVRCLWHLKKWVLKLKRESWLFSHWKQLNNTGLCSLTPSPYKWRVNPNFMGLNVIMLRCW